jgi:Predicted membrane protein
MDRSFVQSNATEILDPSREVVEEFADIVEQVAPTGAKLPSYHPTRWARINNLLDKVDTITNGRAGSLVQFGSFLVFGGTTTIVNLVIMYAILRFVPLHNAQLLNTLASALGCEISLICNFILNDNFTFKHMPGRSRSLWNRFLRFQGTALVGTLLTILIEAMLNNFLHIPSLIGQAIAIVIVLFYNFFMQSFFTYNKNAAKTA